MPTRIVGLILFLNCSFLLYGWGPVGHYSVAREGGYSHAEAGLFNLPDAWASFEYLTAGTITDNFCWSHSVRRNGRSLLVPNIPVYDLSREPGKILKQLAVSKISNWTATNTQTAALNTAKYFTGHNAADNVVHWSYFSGGGGDLTNWTVQHAQKEEWAEYAILDFLKKVTYGSDGKIATFWGNTVDHTGAAQVMPFNVQNINCNIIILAQRVARKNRSFLDIGGNPTLYTDIDSLSGLVAKVQSLANSVNSAVKGMNEDTRAAYRNKLAVTNNWNSNDVESKFYEAVETFNIQLAQ